MRLQVELSPDGYTLRSYKLDNGTYWRAGLDEQSILFRHCVPNKNGFVDITVTSRKPAVTKNVLRFVLANRDMRGDSWSFMSYGVFNGETGERTHEDMLFCKHGVRDACGRKSLPNVFYMVIHGQP